VTYWIIGGVLAAICLLLSLLETAGRISLHQASAICGLITAALLGWALVIGLWLALPITGPALLVFVLTVWITRPRKEQS
jgi:hypothetical protein